MLLSLALAGFLILINAFYVAAEFSTVAARVAQMQMLAHDGNKLAKRLLTIIENPRALDTYIATCQIGITFASLINGAVSEANMGPGLAAQLIAWFQIDKPIALSAAAILILAALTILQILFGELLPKAIALQFSNRVALFMYWPMYISSRLFRPFIWLLNGSGNALLELFNVPASTHKHIHSLDEIELLLAESKDGGLLEPEEHKRLHQAIELSQETVKQIMTPRTKLTAMSVHAAPEEAYKLALESPYTRILAFGDTIDDIRGVINVKEIISARINHTNASLEQLVKPIPIVPANLSMDRLMKELKEHRSHAALVMDEHGGTLGLVTVGDILAELLEEIEIDEFKRETKVEILSDGTVRLPGSYKLKKATTFLGKLPDGDDIEADTINGLIVELSGDVPFVGQTIELEETVLKVEVVEHNVVTLLTVTRKQGE